MESLSTVQYAAIAELALGRRGPWRAHLFELATAVGFLVLGVAYFLNPDLYAFHSVIGRRVFPFDYLWSGGYVLGGLLIALGLVRMRMRMRVAGLIILGTALLLASVAAFVLAPLLRDVFTLVYAVACFVWAYLLTVLFRRYEAACGVARAAGP